MSPRPAGEGPGWIAVALGTAAGFLAGVLVVLALGGGGGDAKQATSAPSAAAQGGQPPTVITRVAVPDLSRLRLDVAKEQVKGLGFRTRVKDDGLFGVLVDENWTVIGQDPPPGQLLQRGALVTLNVAKP
jgi:hypothetical protein